MNDSCVHLNNSIAKYGWENFKVEIVEEGWMTQDERNKKEIALIAKYNFFHGKGYNLVKGGGGTLGAKWTDEQRAAVSGENSHNYGKKVSAETIAKRVAKNRGQKRSEQFCIEQSKRMMGKNKGKRHSTEINAAKSKRMKGTKQSKQHIANNTATKRKSVFGKYKNDKEYIKFVSFKSAAKHFNCSPNTVSAIINGRIKDSPTFDFKFT